MAAPFLSTPLETTQVTAQEALLHVRRDEPISHQPRPPSFDPFPIILLIRHIIPVDLP
jgi:hypothetical protein